MANWKNRIVGTGEESPTDLIAAANPNNPRLHPDRQEQALGDVLDKVGFIDRVIVNKRTGRLIDGHLRVKMALAKGETSVPVEYVDLSAEEEKLVLATFDPIAGLAEFDPEILKGLAESVKLDFDFDLSGVFDNGEFDGLIADGDGGGEPADVEPQIDRAAELQKEWRTEFGQVWQLGRHKIACVDSLDGEVIKILIDADEVSMIWADPPYGISIVAPNGYVGGGEAYDIPFGGVKNAVRRGTGYYPIKSRSKNTTKGLGSIGDANPVDVGKYYPICGDDTTETACKSALLLLDLFPTACHFWWGGNYYTNVLPPSSCWVIWDKDNTGNFADCEMAWTNQPSAARIFEHRWNGMLKASEHGQRRVHPTQKPIALARWCFERYGNPNDVIFDPFLGSGISVLAAEQLGNGRRLIGCEIIPEYIAVIIQRWVDLTGDTPELISDLQT